MNKNRRRSRLRTTLQWIRRAHLYTGLMMLPWVLLYGVTAFLFNHPQSFPDSSREVWTRSDFSGTVLGTPVPPAEEAKGIVRAINEQLAQSDPNAPVLRLVHPEQADYSRDTLSTRVRGAGKEHSVTFNLRNGSAIIQEVTSSNTETPPFAMRSLRFPGSVNDRVRSGLIEAFKHHQLPGEDVGIAIGATLSFPVEVDGKCWIAQYNIQTGAVTGHPVGSSKTLSWRQFLIDLHRTHGYPSQGLMRWFWAVAVDAMFLSMVFWVISGLCMWWQLKALRLQGAVMLMLSLFLSGFIFWGMSNLSTY